MNISARCEYACRAILELASVHSSQETLSSMVIAERRQIPEKYLVHILLQLKRAGLVQSVRGAQGGYRLDRAPEEITLLEVVEAIDGPILQPLPVEDGQAAGLKAVWKETGDAISAVLRRTTMRHIADRGNETEMYYI